MITADLAESLSSKIRGEVRFDDIARMLYRTDASIYEMEPLGLVLPQNENDVVELVRWAVEQGVSILPRGGGTSLGRTVRRCFSTRRFFQVYE